MSPTAVFGSSSAVSTLKNEFVLLLSCDGVVRESRYKVVWRHGHEVGAEFLDVVRSGFALQN